MIPRVAATLSIAEVPPSNGEDASARQGPTSSIYESGRAPSTSGHSVAGLAATSAEMEEAAGRGATRLQSGNQSRISLIMQKSLGV